MLHEHLLLVLHDPRHVAVHDGVLELELLHDFLHGLRVLLDDHERPVGVLHVRILPPALRRKDAVEALLLHQLLVEHLDLAVEVVPLLHGALAGDARHLALHQLRLEIHGVEQLLLALALLVQAADLEREVLDRGLGAADLSEGGGLVRAELVEVLALLVEAFLRHLHLLLDGLQGVEHLLPSLLGVRALLVLVLRRGLRVAQGPLLGLELPVLLLVPVLPHVELPG
mmetsp:Transcript_41567/g.109723  ORF Transcript_41567/g.109723 Transcript_41567/m.109723 type:complete len:227 (-) Transcript_41567:1139-1819(-)